MSKYIAFLRAINVGGHTVKMDHLRGLFEGLGLANVETFIASGNVIFDADVIDTAALEQRIEKHLHNALGYEVATFLRSNTELTQIAAHAPFAPSSLDAPEQDLYIGFMANAPTETATKKLMLFGSDDDQFYINQRELYWLCRKKISKSVISGKQIEKALGMSATLRNVTTVQKLADKYK